MRPGSGINRLAWPSKGLETPQEPLHGRVGGFPAPGRDLRKYFLEDLAGFGRGVVASGRGDLMVAVSGIVGTAC